jgi:uncharacterized protein YjlB
MDDVLLHMLQDVACSGREVARNVQRYRNFSWRVGRDGLERDGGVAVVVGRRCAGKADAMPIIENAKTSIEKITGWQRPSSDDLDCLVRLRKANTFRFSDDGLVPNHPRWDMIVYRGAVKLPGLFDPAAVFEEVFERNGWRGSWRNGIYDYGHYHSGIHEVLGIARGSGKVRFGGPRGRTLTLKAGDVAVLPAGTGHQRLAATDGFLVVGAYPPDGAYDECAGSEDHARAVRNIPKVARPRMDPAYGKKGPLLDLWRA